MKTLSKDDAIKAVEIALISLNPAKAPRYSKETIEAERQKVAQGLTLALQLLREEVGE